MDEITGEVGSCFSDCEASADDVGRFADIEELPLRLVKLENFQGGASVTGINALHVGVFLEDLVQLF